MLLSKSKSYVVAKSIAQKLRDAGHFSYFAGGCVRDTLLGIEPKDYDIATSAEPESIKELFPGSKLVGEAFGVILVKIDGISVEVATFRAEYGYSDGRRPDRVEYTDSKGDATRRDFTINGLFQDPVWTGSAIIDYVGGCDDLRDGVIRAIGDPSKRFAEDYLRMLRAVRFAARLDFTIDRKTAVAIRRSAHCISKISKERIGIEVLSMLTGPRPSKAIKLLNSLHLDGSIFSENHVKLSQLFTANLEPNGNASVALAAWILDRYTSHDSPGVTGVDAADNDISESILDMCSITSCASSNRYRKHVNQIVDHWRSSLVLTNIISSNVLSTINLLGEAIIWRSRNIADRKKLLAHRDWPNVIKLLEYGSADESLCNLLADIRIDSVPLYAQGVNPVPFVSGSDLISLGIKPGLDFKVLLEMFYDDQLLNRVTTKSQAIDALQEVLMFKIERYPSTADMYSWSMISKVDWQFVIDNKIQWIKPSHGDLTR